MKTLLTLLALVAGCTADGGIAYRGPPPEKELFHFNDKVTYYLYSEKAGWDEASAVCQSYKGTLATPDDSIKAQYLAQCIGEAWAPLEDMWIGGQMTQNMWKWVDGKQIPETSRQASNMTFLYPPWVDGALPARKGRNCLAIDRNGHSDPYFIDLECKMKRPFICQSGMDNEQEGPEIKKKITIFEYEYLLYHGRLNWDGAVAYCRSQGYVLASVFNSSYAEKLARAMLKTRPEFEDVWIGGSYKNDKWSWIENSDEIPMDSTPNGASGTLFPPWAHLPPKPGKNCVLFDRHLCETPKFIDIPCNRLRDFVCARVLKESEQPFIVPETTTVRKKKYIIHHTPATFEDARAICEDDKNQDGEGKLLYIDGGEVKDPYDELSIIMQLMSDNANELLHVWLAAKYDEADKSFKWVYDVPNYRTNNTYNTQVLAVEADEATGYPPWCNNDEPTPEMACLNLDRQNYNTPLFYGLECNVTQDVICVFEAKPNGVERFHLNGRMYQSSEFLRTGLNSSWMSARRICEEETGFMLADVEEHELNEITKRLPDGEYFIGGKYSGSPRVAYWQPSQAPVNLPGIRIDPPGKSENCMVLSVANGAPTEIKAVHCDEKLNHNFICYDNCGPEVNEVEDHSWHCNWQEGRAVTEAVLGKACDKRCPINRVLVGSRKLYCKTPGWTGSRNGHAATCEEAPAAAAALTDMIINNVNSSGGNGVLFIYDGSHSVNADELQVIKYIVGSTISRLTPPHAESPENTYTHDNDTMNSNRKRRNVGGHQRRNRRSRSKTSRSRSRRQNDAALNVPIFSLNDNSSHESVLLEGLSECKIVSELGEKHFVRGVGRRNYGRAFAQAKKYLEGANSPFAVVVISAGPNQAGDYRDELRKLKDLAKSVVTIGVGSRYSYEELAEIAGLSPQKVLQHAAVADYSEFKILGDSIAAGGKCSAEIDELKKAADEAVMKIEENNRNGGAVEPEHAQQDDSSNGEVDSNEGPSHHGVEQQNGHHMYTPESSYYDATSESGYNGESPVEGDEQHTGQQEDHELGWTPAQHHGQDQDHDQGQDQGQDHGQGQDQGQDHGQGQDQGQDHGQGQDQGQDHGQGQDQGQDHGQGQDQGQDQGQEHGQAQESNNEHSGAPDNEETPAAAEGEPGSSDNTPAQADETTAAPAHDEAGGEDGAATEGGEAGETPAPDAGT